MCFCFFFQEYPIKLDRCPDLLCDWSDFIEAYKDKLSCDFDEICGIKNGENQNETISLDDDDDSVNGSEERSVNSSSRQTVNSYLIITFVILVIGGWKHSLACL
jgi:hypothetical protein